MNSLSSCQVKNNVELDLLLSEASNYVCNAAQSGTAAHEVERTVFDFAIRIGQQMLGNFFQLQGDGDIGEYHEVAGGKRIKRLKCTTRIYRSILGDFKISRYGYGSRNKQAIECYPLDTRLQLPEEEPSYPVQELFQTLTTEVSYDTARGILKKLLKMNATVDSMERVNQRCGDEVPSFRGMQQAPDPETEAELFVLTGDGKGVPIRHAKDASRIRDHRLKSGPKPDR